MVCYAQRTCGRGRALPSGHGTEVRATGLPRNRFARISVGWKELTDGEGQVMRAKSLICRNRIRGIEDALESWRQNHDQAMCVRDIEDIAKECIWLTDLFKGWSED